MLSVTVSVNGTEPIVSEGFNDKVLDTDKYAFGPPTGYVLGEVTMGRAPVLIELSDGHGLKMTLDPGEGVLVMGTDAHDIGTEPVFVQCLVWTSDPGATVALAALNIGRHDNPDGRMAYTTRKYTDPPEDAELLGTVCAAPSGVMLPAFQAVLSPDAKGPVEIFFDNFEVIPARFPEVSDPIELDPMGDFESGGENLLTGINDVPGDAKIVPTDSGHALQLTTTAEGGAANAGLSPASLSFENKGWLFVQADVISSDPGPNYITLLLTSNKETACVVDYPTRLVTSAKDRLCVGALFKEPLDGLFAAAQNTQLPELPGVPENIVLDNLVVFSHAGDLDPLPVGPDEDSVAAMMLAPEKIRVGNQSSVTVTTVAGKEHTPQSVPVNLSLSKSGGTPVPVFEGTTDAQGHLNASFTVPKLAPGTYKLQLVAEDAEPLSADITVEEGPVLFIETDKPIYKPGQTIQGRVLTLNNALTPLSSPVEVSISDAKAIKIHKETIEANEFGVASFELSLADKLNLGTWTIRAKSSNEEVILDIEVDKYVLPKFDVELKPERDWFLVDEEISGVIEAEYFFGKPVNGTVNIAASRYIGNWDRYASFSGELTDGRVEFTLPPVEYIAGTTGAEGAGTLQLDMVVTDEGGHEERTTTLLRIVDAPVQARMIAESNTIKPGFPLQILLVTETPDGKPTDSSVTLRTTFYGEGYGSISDSRQTVTTENGLRLLEIPVPDKAIAAQIIAELKVDEHTTTATLDLNGAFSPSASFIHIRQEQFGKYKVGDSASFQVRATNPGTIYYDVFASGRTVFSGATSERTIQFRITPEMSPKSKIVAYIINPNNEVAADVLPFEVELSQTDDLNAEFSAEEVLPGESVSLQLKSAGEAMVGLSIVDESVYALSEGRLNLQQVFAELERIFMEPQAETHEENNWWWGVRAEYRGAVDILKSSGLQMVTSKGFLLPEGETSQGPIFWRGGPEEGGGPIPAPVDAGTGVDDKSNQLAEVQRVRQFFPETWLWEPDLLLNDDGSATLDLTAPDSITTWRLHAVSTSERGLGIAEGSVRVFQDFFVEPDLPYAVTRGEEFPLRLQVFNYVDQPQEVRIELKTADFFEALGEVVHTVTVQPSSVASVSIPIRPTKVGLWTLEVIAQSSSRADAIRKEFRVEPEGTRRESITNGIIHEGETIELDGHFPDVPYPRPVPEDDTIKDLIPPDPDLPIGIVPDSGRMRVAITPSLVGQSMNGIDDLLGMPYGCGEQNMMFLAPDIEVLRYLSFTSQLNPEIRAKAEHFINVGYQRQLTYQRNDSSFSAFGQSDEIGSLWLTAFVLSTFSMARDVRTIDDSVLAGAATWIENYQLADGSWEPVGFLHHQEMIGGMKGNYGLTAFVSIALSNYGNGSADVLSKAISYLENNYEGATDNPYVLAIGAYALSVADSPVTNSVLDQLLTLSQTDKNGIYWTPNPVETTAYAGLALMEQNRPEATQALSWLASQRNSLGGFGSTQDTVMAFRALAHAAMLQSRDLNATIEVVLDGETLHTFEVNRENFDVLQVFELPRQGDLELRHNGTGDVTYQLARIYNVWAVDENLPSNGMDLTVEYSADHVAVDDIVDVNVSATFIGHEPVPLEPDGSREPAADEGEKPIIAPRPEPEPTKPIPPDTEPTPEPEPYSSGMIILDISVPTGFATVAESLDSVLDMQKVKRIEHAGRKVIFYVDELASGETIEFTFQVRALFPVKAIVGTSTAYSYYETDLRAEVAGPNIVVE